jgi:hypothetical protein
MNILRSNIQIIRDYQEPTLDVSFRGLTLAQQGNHLQLHSLSYPFSSYTADGMLPLKPQIQAYSQPFEVSPIPGVRYLRTPLGAGLPQPIPVRPRRMSSERPQAIRSQTAPAGREYGPYSPPPMPPAPEIPTTVPMSPTSTYSSTSSGSSTSTPHWAALVFDGKYPETRLKSSGQGYVLFKTHHTSSISI